jgi:DNA-binding SARP family transcriptional activator
VVAARQAGADLEPNRENREVRSVLRGLFERVDRLDDQLPGIRRLLRRTARTILVPPPMLTIHAFGRGQVWVNGRLVTAREWQTQAVRELFFFFLAMNKPVTKEQVASVLWPDTTEPAKLKLRFKNEIYRLRRAVGQETILYEDEYYQVNPAIDHEYDVEAFDSFVERARTAVLPSEQIRLYRKATELVTGPYLEDLGAVWIMPERERLHQAHIASLLSLGELLFREGEPIAALEACRHLLDAEPTSEAGYRLKMHIHDRLGDKAALIRAYRECEASLEDVFGMPPSEETQALFRKLAA